MTQPAAVSGMDRSAEPLVALWSAAEAVERLVVVLGCMVVWLCVVAGGMVDWLCAVIVRCVVAGDCVVSGWA